ncbi:hypothetical protein AM228_14615 [Planktothricoides sp. SR001]|nr:hypothetical protein AM228_14615 [Planktothricoides sp. SR001]
MFSKRFSKTFKKIIALGKIRSIRDPNEVQRFSGFVPARERQVFLYFITLTRAIRAIATRIAQSKGVYRDDPLRFWL